jgi:hypothetical protein
MPWKINIIDVPEYIELQYSGIVTQNDLIEAFLHIVEIVKEKKYNKVVTDCSAMIKNPSIAELYGQIDMYEKSGIDRSIKEAIIIPNVNEFEENARFYETACFNRGFNVKLCNNLNEALSWLFS